MYDCKEDVKAKESNVSISRVESVRGEGKWRRTEESGWVPFPVFSKSIVCLLEQRWQHRKESAGFRVPRVLVKI